ncbi:hypothetical protein FA15DRAFT_698780, partial [Coprinopsis marcescibilis]
MGYKDAGEGGTRCHGHCTSESMCTQAAACDRRSLKSEDHGCHDDYARSTWSSIRHLVCAQAAPWATRTLESEGHGWMVAVQVKMSSRVRIGKKRHGCYGHCTRSVNLSIDSQTRRHTFSHSQSVISCGHRRGVRGTDAMVTVQAASLSSCARSGLQTRSTSLPCERQKSTRRRSSRDRDEL